MKPDGIYLFGIGDGSLLMDSVFGIIYIMQQTLNELVVCVKVTKASSIQIIGPLNEWMGSKYCNKPCCSTLDLLEFVYQ